MVSISRRHPMPPKPRAAEVLVEQHMKKSKDKQPDMADNPDAGRSTKQGRKMESPASIRSSGPSGQSGRAKHQTRHPNK